MSMNTQGSVKAQRTRTALTLSPAGSFLPDTVDYTAFSFPFGDRPLTLCTDRLGSLSLQSSEESPFLLDLAVTGPPLFPARLGASGKMETVRTLNIKCIYAHLLAFLFLPPSLPPPFLWLNPRSWSHKGVLYYRAMSLFLLVSLVLTGQGSQTVERFRPQQLYYRVRLPQNHPNETLWLLTSQHAVAAPALTSMLLFLSTGRRKWPGG